MTRPTPAALLARIREHQRWLETCKKEGQQFAQQGVDLHDLDLSGCDLAWVALSDACLDRVLLHATNLNNAIFYDASFVQAIMDNAQLIGIDAKGSKFSEASLRRVQGLSAEFYEANLPNAKLTQSNFYDADFQKTNLEGANFSHVNLRWASLRDAHLAHAILTGTQVEGTTFIGATGIETVEVEWIDVGSEKAPQRLEGKQAKNWLLRAVTERNASETVPHTQIIGQEKKEKRRDR